MKIINNTFTEDFTPIVFKGVRNDETKKIAYGYLFVKVLKTFKTKRENQIGESIYEQGKEIGIKVDATNKRDGIKFLKYIIITQ